MKLPGVTQLIRLSETESTQKVARELALKNFSEGTLIWADAQTQGRGRLDRKWVSQKGGLYFTLILRPKISPRLLAGLSLETAHSIAQALKRNTHLETQVKPPNDVLARSHASQPYKKICGILPEASGSSQWTDWILLGVGVNVNNPISPRLRHATSLSQLTGHSLDGEEVLRAVLKGFWESYRVFLRQRY
ncbi:MAG: biotin--[acetyl-CoA-carboxylase] ligase [Elusimicrobia bacterium]|nr:biotin--[acetyl-CoA-carboxylase] ligase [Elusimicrobiota bacterium]